MLRMLFEFEGFDVTDVSSPIEATAAALQGQPAFTVVHQHDDLAVEKDLRVLRRLVPEARIVAFARDLTETPPWTDAFLNENRVMSVTPLLGGLIAAGVA